MDPADSSAADSPRTALGRIVAAFDGAVVRADPRAAEVRGAIIAEPGDTLADARGALVLAIGARGADAIAVVAAAGKAGAAAVAVKCADSEEGLPELLRAAGEKAGVAVCTVPVATRWHEVEAAVRGAGERGAAGPDTRGDLYSLAQTVATLTHGVVSIEDSAHRVMAYSDSGDEADELRRRSILGRNCPEPYLALLRQWGVYVYRRVRTDELVEVEERPEMGIRRRLVIGINAGPRPLGTIWVQEGGRPLAERSAEAMRGAARLAASQLVDHYYQGDSAARLPSRADLAHGLLTGRFNSGAVAVHLGIAPSAAARVVAVDLREPHADDGDTSGADVRRAEAAEIVSVHAAAYRTNALVAQACGQIYAMLPESPRPDSGRTDSARPDSARPEGGEPDDEPVLRWAGDLVAALRRHTRTPAQAVLAGTAARLDDIPAVKLRGHHALRLLARTPDRAVDTHSRLTAPLMVRDLLELLDKHQEIRHPAVAALAARDAEHGTDLARSLLLYLDAFGDVARVARQLNVHPNTLRYRVRRAAALTGLDLDDPEHRLAAMLQLRLTCTSVGGSPFPAA
ncbi:helix-turn-helix domain-containing protein [Streptomyces sp. NPDC059900]|uniref:PucR family transcriptional regulator n=1 Tax=Streptomyces sp. NPDC059900 TaxID=3155816 RepID=UPI00342C2258